MTSDTSSTPLADIDITLDLPVRLLADQFPDLSGLPLKIIEAGWDNVMVRVGDTLALRLPRRLVAAQLILSEQKWLPWLAPQLPLPVPVPVKVGEPTDYYPYPWSVQTWLSGEAADISFPVASEAPVLANFFKILHGLELPDDAPRNPVRDCGLVSKQLSIEIRMSEIERETNLITPTIKHIWEAGLAEIIDTPRCFIAGDVHARNVLVEDGRLSAIIDWGDMCAGDPATDLASIWGLFEDKITRRTAIDAYEMSAPLLTRTKGWAVFYGVILLHTGRKDTPRHAKMGEDILRRLNVDGL